VQESHQRAAAASLAADDAYVEFWPAGTRATGRFRCAVCGSAVTLHQVLPRCSMCGDGLWERATWNLFAQRVG
jgi:hypothetical protein